jgi:hypothetical protein
MSLPSKTDLQTLDITWRGLPFCWVEATSLNTQSLDITWRGLPFVAATAASTSTGVTNSGGWGFGVPKVRKKKKRLDDVPLEIEAEPVAQEQEEDNSEQRLLEEQNLAEAKKAERKRQREIKLLLKQRAEEEAALKAKISQEESKAEQLAQLIQEEKDWQISEEERKAYEENRIIEILLEIDPTSHMVSFAHRLIVLSQELPAKLLAVAETPLMTTEQLAAGLAQVLLEWQTQLAEVLHEISDESPSGIELE